MGNSITNKKNSAEMYYTKTFKVNDIEEFINLSFSDLHLSFIFTINLTKQSSFIHHFFSNIKQRIRNYKEFKIKDIYLITENYPKTLPVIPDIMRNVRIFLTFFFQVFIIYNLIIERNKALKFTLQSNLYSLIIPPSLKIKTYLFIEFNRFLNDEYLFYIKEVSSIKIGANRYEKQTFDIYQDIIQKVVIDEKNIDTYIILYGKFWNQNSHFKDLENYLKVILNFLLETQKSNFCLVLNFSYKDSSILKYIIYIFSQLIESNNLNKKVFDKQFILKLILCDKSNNVLDVKEICQFNSLFYQNIHSFLYALHTKNSIIQSLKRKVIICNVYSYLNGFLSFKRLETRVILNRDYWFNNNRKMRDTLSNSAYII